MLADLVNFITQATQRTEELVNTVVNEFEKLVEEYVLGYSENIGRAQSQKLAVIQLINFISMIIKALKARPDCDKEQRADIVTNYIAERTASDLGWTITQQENGEILIQQPEEQIDPILPFLNALYPPNDLPSPDPSGFGEIIETGDPVVDGQLADIVDEIKTPDKIKLGCQFDQVGLVEIDQINDWIAGR